MSRSEYEVYAIKYAERDARRPDHFVGGDPHDVPMPMDYFIWLVRNADRVVLIDTGFDAAPSSSRPMRATITSISSAAPAFP